MIPHSPLGYHENAQALRGSISTRAKLVQCAARLIQQRGYFALRTADIISQSGVPKGSLYHHFPGGKSELTIAALNWVTQEVITVLQSAKRWSSSPSRVVEKLILGIADWLESNDWNAGSLTSILAQETATTEPAIFRATQKAYADIAAELASLFSAAGILECDADRLAALTLSVIEGATTVSRVMQNRNALEEAALCLSNQINRYVN